MAFQDERKQINFHSKVIFFFLPDCFVTYQIQKSKLLFLNVFRKTFLKYYRIFSDKTTELKMSSKFKDTIISALLF